MGLSGYVAVKQLNLFEISSDGGVFDELLMCSLNPPFYNYPGCSTTI